MVVTKVNAVSVAKVAAVLCAGLGLLTGAMLSVDWHGRPGGALTASEGGAFLGALFGAGAIIIMPICYGALGSSTPSSSRRCSTSPRE